MFIFYFLPELTFFKDNAITIQWVYMSILEVETTSPSAAMAGLKLTLPLLSRPPKAGFTGVTEDKGQLQGRKRTEKTSRVSQKVQRTSAKAQEADEMKLRLGSAHHESLFPPIFLP